MTATPPPGQPATPAEALRQCVALFDPGPCGPDATEATVEVRNIALMMNRWADELDTAPAALSTLPLAVKPEWEGSCLCEDKEAHDPDCRQGHSPDCGAECRSPVGCLRRTDMPVAYQAIGVLASAAQRFGVGLDPDDTWGYLSDICDALARATDPGPAAPTAYRLPAEPPPEVTELWAADGGKAERNTNRLGGWWYRGMVWPWEPLLRKAGPLSTVPPAGTEAS